MPEPATTCNCSYCESLCGADSVYLKNQVYCCYGCATLDDVISQIELRPDQINIRFKQFDHPELRAKLIEFENDKLYKLTFSLPAIHCASCVELLEDLPRFNALVLRTSVNFESRSATIWANSELELSSLAQLLDNVGYPPQLNFRDNLELIEKRQRKTDLFKMAFAGFCFGNIMLYSMPHYFGLNFLSDHFFSTLFLGLSLVLSFPLVLFSGKSYLESAYKALRKNKAHIHVPIAIGILGLWFWSIYEILSGTGIGYLDSLSGLVFFLLVGRWFQSRIYDQVSYKRELEEFIPLLVRKVKTQNQFDWVKAGELRKGDRILVKNNELIPVDAVLFSESALIDYSFITGEQLPEQVDAFEEVFAGGRQIQGEIILGLAEAPSENRLWSAWQGELSKSHEAEWTNRISGYFTLAVLAIALIAGMIWYFIDSSSAIFVTTAVLIVACPCALALSGPFTYGNIMRVFARNGLFLKQAEAVHSMGRVEHLYLDKTGTLTNRHKQSISFVGALLTEIELDLIYNTCRQSTHPLSRLISTELDTRKILKTEDYVEEPAKGIRCITKGYYMQIGSLEWLEQSDASGNASRVGVAIDGKFRGYFELKQNYRRGLSSVLDLLGKGRKLSLLSGDNDSERRFLTNLYREWADLRFGLKPIEKAEIVEEAELSGTECMIGDGLNDTIALSKSSIGIAVTESLNDFYPGADAVLLAENFDKLGSFFELSVFSSRILRWSLVFSILYNLGGLAFAVSGNLTPVVAAILMPLSSITVVLLVALLVKYKSKQLKLI